MEVKPGYKQNEIGITPEDWDVKPLMDVFTLKHGFPFSSAFFSKTGPIVLTPGNFKLEGGLYFEERNTKRYCGYYSPSMTFRKEDLLIVMTDLTPECNLLGKPAFIDTDDIVLHNQRIGKVQLKSKIVDLWFLFYMLLSRRYLDRIKEQATGSTVRHTSNKSIYSVQLAWPPLPEQRAIATALSDVDALITSLDKLIAKKRAIKTATTQQLLTGKKRLPGFSGEWEVKRLGDVAVFHKGKGLPKSDLDSYGKDACIHYGELFTQYNVTISKTISRTNSSSDAFRSIANDVLMPTSDVTPTGLAKASCVTADNIVLGGDILVVRTNPNVVNGTFLSSIIRNDEDQVLRLVTGSTVYHLYGSDMQKFIFSMPQLSEQRAIVDLLSDIDTEITALEVRLDKTKAIKQGMMQELLTGRTRLI